MKVTMKMNKVLPALRLIENNGSPIIEPIVTVVACAMDTTTNATKEYLFNFEKSF